MTKRVTLQPGDIVCYNVGKYKPRSWDYDVKPGKVVKHPYTSAFEKVSE